MLSVRQLIDKLGYLLDNGLIKYEDVILIGSLSDSNTSTLNVNVAYPRVIPDINSMDDKKYSVIGFVQKEDIDGIDPLAFLKGNGNGRS